MTFVSRLIAPFALLLAATLAVPAAAATVPSFQGTIDYGALLDGDVADVLAIGTVTDADGDLFELSIGGVFDLDPLGANPSFVFLNIFDDTLSLVLESSTLLSSVIEMGPIATLVFQLGDGSVRTQFPPEARVVLSGLIGPDANGGGTVDVAVFLAPIPLPAAAPLLVSALLILGFARRRISV